MSRIETPTRIMLVDDIPGRAAIVEQSLVDQGYSVICRLNSAQGLLKRVEEHRPDVIIIDLDSPDRDVLESMSLLSQANPTPVIMFSGEEDTATIQKAVGAGVSAYIVGDIGERKVKPIVEVAIARFREFHALRQELTKTQSQLASRKSVEKAKGLLMQQRQCSEPEAYAAIRKLAMDQNKSIGDVAKSIISVLELTLPTDKS